MRAEVDVELESISANTAANSLVACPESFLPETRSLAGVQQFAKFLLQPRHHAPSQQFAVYGRASTTRQPRECSLLNRTRDSKSKFLILPPGRITARSFPAVRGFPISDNGFDQIRFLPNHTIKPSRLTPFGRVKRGWPDQADGSTFHHELTA
jgi:hypothetical protein